MKKKVTIQDIADALGISRNTVSKAINNSDGLADATRERILQKAVEMGYKQFSYISTLTRAVPTVQVEPPNTPMNHGEISLFTTFFHHGFTSSWFVQWVTLICQCFPMALCTQLFLAGPLVRFVFRHLFAQHPAHSSEAAYNQAN